MSDRPRLSVAFVSVGSNIEPRQNVVAALAALMKSTRVIGSSTFYQTEPIGRQGQPAFINGVWVIHTEMRPIQVRDDLLRPIEDGLGRRRVEDKFAPRTIDLDLVLYDDLVLDGMDLRLPHKDIERPFVSVPIRELLQADVAKMAQGLRDHMMRLLPRDQTTSPPGEILEDLTYELRQMIDRPEI